MAASSETSGVSEGAMTITGNKCFFLEPELTFKSKENIKRQILQQMPGVQEVSVDECDFIVALCYIMSRAGADIDGAVRELNKRSAFKPAIFMVLHHTFDPEKTVPDSRSFVKRSRTFAVDCLFHEDTGLLKCVMNDEAQSRIRQCLKPLVTSSTDTQIDTGMITEEAELILVLLGKSRSVKTAVAHMILGRKEAQADISPDTQMTITADHVNGQQVTVIDSPDCSTEDMKRQLQLCIRLSSGGPYVFLLVISDDEESKKMEMMLEEIVGKNIVVLFTVTDEEQKQIFKEQRFQRFHNYDPYVLNINQDGNKSAELWDKLQKVAKREDFVNVKKLKNLQ